MGVVNKIKTGGSSGTTHLIASSAYGTCSTAMGTQVKEVVISSWDSSLVVDNITGTTIHVKFTNTNTHATPQLKIVAAVGGTALIAAKNIYKYGTTAPGTTAATSWAAGSVVSFTYDGSAWQMNDHIDSYLTGVTFAGTSMTVSGGTASISLANARSALGLATVATSGSYNDLTNKPTIPTNTDEKLKVAAVTSNTVYYPIVGVDTTAATRQYDTTGFSYVGQTGTAQALGFATLQLGNNTASGTANNKQGQLILYGSTAYAHTIQGAPSANRTLTLPDKTGTIALTSDISSVSTVASATTGITASTTATKTTLGTAFTIPNVTNAGSASTWSFTDVTIPIRADSDTTVPTAASSATACDDITAWSAGSGSFTSGSFDGGAFSATVSNEILSFSFTPATHGADSHTHTASSLSYTARSITGVSGSTTVRGVKTGTSSTTTASKASGANGTAPTLGTAFTVPNVTGNTSATVSITDNGHTHSLS